MLKRTINSVLLAQKWSIWRRKKKDKIFQKVWRFFFLHRYTAFFVIRGCLWMYHQKCVNGFREACLWAGVWATVRFTASSSHIYYSECPVAFETGFFLSLVCSCYKGHCFTVLPIQTILKVKWLSLQHKLNKSFYRLADCTLPISKIFNQGNACFVPWWIILNHDKSLINN